MFIVGLLALFAVGSWDSGAFDNGGFDFEAVKDGSDGKLCTFVDTQVLQYDGSRCPTGKK